MVAVTISLSAPIARGVNTLLTRLRITRCSGGSMEMIIFAGTFSPLRTMPRSTPYADEYVSKSLNPAATSTCRLSA